MSLNQNHLTKEAMSSGFFCLCWPSIRTIENIIENISIDLKVKWQLIFKIFLRRLNNIFVDFFHCRILNILRSPVAFVNSSGIKQVIFSHVRIDS